jgi:hypothetical protein
MNLHDVPDGRALRIGDPEFRGRNQRCGASHASIAVPDESAGPSMESEAKAPSRPINVVATVCPSGISTMKAMAPLWENKPGQAHRPTAPRRRRVRTRLSGSGARAGPTPPAPRPPEADYQCPAARSRCLSVNEHQ